jgi:hypothetical protein
MTAVNKTNKIKIETHRGKEDTALENIPGSFQLDNIDSKKPNRFGFYRYRPVSGFYL